MNMKKIKKFFTLARRHDGFTLVELIVVIAILAILGGVAVPAYGGYVKRANMQADITLASEVAQALTLGYYGGTISGGGYIVLNSDGTPVTMTSGENVEKAMVAAFGENWRETAVLKYDGWNPDNVLPSAEEAALVANSNYYKNKTPAELVKSFSSLTDALSGMSNTASQDPLITMKNLGVLSDSDVVSLRTQLDGMNVGWDKDKDAYTTAVSNLLVKNTASEISNAEEGAEISGMSQMAVNYAMLYAWSTTSADGAAALAEVDKVLTNPNSNSSDAIKAIDDAYALFVNSGAQGEYLEDYGATDITALQSIMGTVSDWSADADMTEKGLYSSDSITGAVNSYTAAVAVTNGMGLTQDQVTALAGCNGVIIFVTPTGETVCTMPAQ